MNLTARTLTTLILTSLLVLLTATFSLAHRDSGRGHGQGYGCDCGASAPAELTTDQQKQLEDLKDSYADRFAELDSALDTQWESYREARSNPETRVAELDQFRDKIHDLRDQHRSLRREYHDQAITIAPTGYPGLGAGGERGYCDNFDAGPQRGHGYCDGPGPKGGYGHGMHRSMHRSMGHGCDG